MVGGHAGPFIAAVALEKPGMVPAPHSQTKVLNDRIKGFARFLIDKRMITSTDLKNALHIHGIIDLRIGHLAATKNFLSMRDVFYILSCQRDMAKRFGEVAIEKGLLTPAQVLELVDIQQDPLKVFVESVCLCKVVEYSALSDALKEFMENGSAAATPRRETPVAGTPAVAADDAAKPAAAPQMDRGSAQSLLRRIDSVATMPVIVQKLLTVLSDPNVEIESVTKMIESEPALSAQLLRLANSASFGFRAKVAHVSRILLAMGFNGVRRFVLMTAVFEKFRGIDAPGLVDLWRHSMLSSHWSRAILTEKGFKGEDVENAFFAGLVHELGQVAIWQVFSKMSPQIDALVKKGVPQTEAETAVLGMTHMEIGAYMCNFWKFPDEIVHAVRYHHVGTKVVKNIAGGRPVITRVTNASCRLAFLPLVKLSDDGSRQAVDFTPLTDDFLEVHELEVGMLERLMPEVLAETEKLAELLLKGANK
jgi:HD-like signal output (HDOD) protein